MKQQVVIFTLGQFIIRSKEQDIAPPPRQGETLCKMLVCQPNRQAPCSWLAEKLWPQADGDQAMQYLYNSVTALRAALGVDVLITHRSTQSYQFVGQDRLWIDADAALERLSQAQAVGRTTEQALPLLEQAMQYFRRGKFLAGVEESWAYVRRRAVEMGKERALFWLVEAYQQQGQWQKAEALLTEALAEDPLNENLLCSLMQILHAESMTHQALRTYEECARVLKKTDQEPAETTTELYQRLKRAPRVLELPSSLLTAEPPAPQAAPESLPIVIQQAESSHTSSGNGRTTQQTGLMLLISDRLLGIAWSSHNQYQALNLLYATPDALPDAHHLGAWIALGARYLSQVFEAGWSPEMILDTLQIILPVIQALSPAARRALIEGGIIPSIPDLSSLSSSLHLSDQEQVQLCQSLGVSIGESWKRFCTASMPQVLSLGQAQLCFIQQIHALLPPDVRLLLYSALYRLIGGVLFFHARYAEALKAHEQAYLAALEANDAWNMAESLGWQSGVWKACGQQEKAIQITQAALRLIECGDQPFASTTRARLLAQWAESAALLQQPHIVEEKLEASRALLAHFPGNEEFDISIWHSYNGVCAFYLDQAATAEVSFQEALEGHQQHWLLQRAITTLLQAETRLKMGAREASLQSAHEALPLLLTLNAPLLSWGLRDYIESLCRQFPGSPDVRHFAEQTQYHWRFPMSRTIPRYLEAKLA